MKRCKSTRGRYAAGRVIEVLVGHRHRRGYRLTPTDKFAQLESREWRAGIDQIERPLGSLTPSDIVTLSEGHK